MRDPMTFEDRLSEAFAAYTAAAPLDVDPRALAAELAGGSRSRRLALPTFNLARFGGVRLALVLGLLALATVAGLLFAGGFLRPDPAPLGADGRILVWPRGSEPRLLRNGVEVPVTLVGERCPVLIATAGAIGERKRFSGVAFRGYESGRQSQWYRGANMEFWSPDHSAYAVVAFENGASVFTFPNGEFVNPTITDYPISGVKDAFFSADGSRLTVTVAAGPDSLAIHVLQDGTDAVIATVPSAGDPPSWGSWSPDGESLVIPTTGEVTGRRLSLVRMDGSVFHLGRPDGLAPDASLVPLAWSEGVVPYLVVGSDSGAAWVLDVGRVEWQPLLTPIDLGNPALIRWSQDGRLAIVNGGWLTIHSFDGTPDRKVKLPGLAAVWSPDGRSVASIAEGSDGDDALWVTDAWETGGSRQIAVLRAADWSGFTPPSSETLCIDWQPEVQP